MARDKIRLDKLDARRRFRSKRAYLVAETAAQKRMLATEQARRRAGARAVIVFEGQDAAGKGGAIRRLTSRLDPRGCKVWPIGAPSPDEQGAALSVAFLGAAAGAGRHRRLRPLVVRARARRARRETRRKGRVAPRL